MAKKKLGEYVSVLDAVDKASNTPEVPKTLLERFEEDIDWLVDSDMDEDRYLSAIASKDYVKASEYQHRMMVLQYHREFVPRIKDAIANNTLDNLMSGILNCIMSPSDRPRAYELARLDAAREHWKLVSRIINARDK